MIDDDNDDHDDYDDDWFCCGHKYHFESRDIEDSLTVRDRR